MAKPLLIRTREPRWSRGIVKPERRGGLNSKLQANHLRSIESESGKVRQGFSCLNDIQKNRGGLETLCSSWVCCMLSEHATNPWVTRSCIYMYARQSERPLMFRGPSDPENF